MASSCPSIEDCNNPATIPKEGWKLKYVNSQEVNDPGLAVMSFDGDPSTIWHTRWSTGSDPYPHEIQVDMEDEYVLSVFEYLTRQEGVNGRIKAYGTLPESRWRKLGRNLYLLENLKIHLLLNAFSFYHQSGHGI
ncbi:MAG: discoidin domain-containing protein [Saprospiraceae bacterium]|nr:discoidin domain-containing protein [Saprospiraceae bacterium]